MENIEEFNEEEAVIELLQKGHLFLNSRKYFCESRKDLQPETIVLFLNCNDTFSWGCTDAEEIKLSELEDLYKLYKEYGDASVTIWVCKKRNEKPQDSVLKWLKQQNVFDPIKDLPENRNNILRGNQNGK